MHLSLLPRVRVNYIFAQIISSLFISEKKRKYRDGVIEQLCSMFDVDNVLLTSSGRGGLYWILKSLPQTKVVVPAYTCQVVVEAIILAGKQVLYASTSGRTFNADVFSDLDSDTIVIATHQYGFPCDIESISASCRIKGAVLVEDCAGALGTLINGRLAGTFGDFAFFSFDSSKLLTCPSKGGFIISKDNDSLLSVSKILQTKDSTFKYKIKHLTRGTIYCLLKNKILYRFFHYITMGRKGMMQLPGHDNLNLKLSEFYQYGFYEWQAYFISKQLSFFDKIVSKRKKVFEFYNSHINNKLIVKPVFNNNACCIRYPILVKDKYSFYLSCLRKGVDFGFSFDHIASPKEWEEEHMIARCVLNVPYYYRLSECEQKRVVEVLNSIE